jgi:small-conductance mechanosensitive channel
VPNAPFATLVRFADSGIDLELGVWINDPENGQGNLKSLLNLAILRLFRDNGISIPFPRREVSIVGAIDARAAPTRPRTDGQPT